MQRAEDEQLDQTSLKRFLIDVLLSVAKANSLVFAREVDTTVDEAGSDGYARMEEALMESREKVYNMVSAIEADKAKQMQEQEQENDAANSALEEKIIQEYEALLAENSDDSGSEAFSQGVLSSSTLQSSAASDVIARHRKGKGKPAKKRVRVQGAPPSRRRVTRKKKMPASLSRLPNFHNASHIVENARNFGTDLNCSCSVGEVVHRVWKDLVQHTNYVELDLVFCRYNNTMNGIRQVSSYPTPSAINNMNILATGWHVPRPCLD